METLSDQQTEARILQGLIKLGILVDLGDDDKPSEIALRLGFLNLMISTSVQKNSI